MAQNVFNGTMMIEATSFFGKGGLWVGLSNYALWNVFACIDHPVESTNGMHGVFLCQGVMLGDDVGLKSLGANFREIQVVHNHPLEPQGQPFIDG